jgi:hypothetical protein
LTSVVGLQAQPPHGVNALASEIDGVGLLRRWPFVVPIVASDRVPSST